jgi:hypothetical protein
MLREKYGVPSLREKSRSGKTSQGTCIKCGEGGYLILNDLETFVTDISTRRHYHCDVKLDGTRSVVNIDDYVMLLVQHTDGTTLYIHKSTYSNIALLTQAFTAYLKKYSPT